MIRASEILELTEVWDVKKFKGFASVHYSHDPSSLADVMRDLKDDIKRLLRHLNGEGLTIIHVTHDYREAVSLASMVGVIHNGRIIQEGKPDQVFRKPVNKFVARYSGIRNFFRVQYVLNNGSWKAFCSDNLAFNIPDCKYPSEGLMILRSDDILISKKFPDKPLVNCYKGIVKEILPSEYGQEIEVDAGETFYVDVPSDNSGQMSLKEGTDVWISFSPEACVALQAEGRGQKAES